MAAARLRRAVARRAPRPRQRSPHRKRVGPASAAARSSPTARGPSPRRTELNTAPKPSDERGQATRPCGTHGPAAAASAEHLHEHVHHLHHRHIASHLCSRKDVRVVALSLDSMTGARLHATRGNSSGTTREPTLANQHPAGQLLPSTSPNPANQFVPANNLSPTQPFSPTTRQRFTRGANPSTSVMPPSTSATSPTDNDR